MNYVRLAAYAWVAYVTINLFILLIDFIAVIFFGISLDVALTGYFAGMVGTLVGVLVGVTLGVYAAYKLTKWLHRKAQENAANKLRQLGFNVEPRDMSFLAHRYHLMLLPTPETEEEFRGRFGELRARYTSALTAAIVVVSIYVVIFTLIYVANVLAIDLFVTLTTWSWHAANKVMWGLAPLAVMPFIGLFSGLAYASEELKTIVLRRPETTEADIKKVLNAIGQGILDAILY